MKLPTPERARIFTTQLQRKLSSRRIACPFCGSLRATLRYKLPNVQTSAYQRGRKESVVTHARTGERAQGSARAGSLG